MFAIGPILSNYVFHRLSADLRGRDDGESEDFEGAIAMGSDEVRIGSTIFGQRPPKSEAKVVEGTAEKS